MLEDENENERAGADEREPPDARPAAAISAGARESRGAFVDVGVSEETLRRRVSVSKSSAVGGRE